MIKKITLLGLLLSLTACVNTKWSSDGMNYNEHYMHHTQDSVGTGVFPAKRTATGNKTIIFDPKALAWAAYDREGNRVKTGRASGGKDFCDDINEPCRTVTGHYRIYKKQGPSCKSSKYPIETNGGAKMPYCMHFYQGYSIHAGVVPRGNASHGCIRVLPSAAEWLNKEFADVGTSVIVKPY